MADVLQDAVHVYENELPEELKIWFVRNFELYAARWREELGIHGEPEYTAEDPEEDDEPEISITSYGDEEEREI